MHGRAALLDTGGAAGSQNFQSPGVSAPAPKTAVSQEVPDSVLWLALRGAVGASAGGHSGGLWI